MMQPARYTGPVLMGVGVLVWMILGCAAATALLWAEGTEPLAVVVNKGNEVTNLTLGDLSRVYKGQRETWLDGQKIIAINHAIDSSARRQFYTMALGSDSTEKFFIPGTPLPFHTMVFKSSRLIVKYVSTTPTAIGYVPLSDVNDTVKVLRLDGLTPTQAGYPLN